MFLPRFSTRTMLIILAVAALLFAIVSQGLIGLAQRWELQPGQEADYYSGVSRLGQVGVWRQICAALSVAAVALGLLMTINAVFFLIGWGLSAVFRSRPKDPPAAETADATAATASPQEIPQLAGAVTNGSGNPGTIPTSTAITDGEEKP